MNPKFDYAWNAKHLRYLDNKLVEVVEKLERGESVRLMVSMPPRHFKSQTATAHFPAWTLGKHPDWPVITSSYSASLVQGFSRQTRALVNQYGPDLFGMISHKGTTEEWQVGVLKQTGTVTETGQYKCAGVGGSLTGKGAKILIIDDPHKDRAEANSETMRKRVWEWYTSTAYTRLESVGAIIVIQTRWHDEDLSGMLIKAMADVDNEFADKWDIISFPALAEEDDVLGRTEGDPLWPSQFPLRKYYAIRANIGTYEWFPLYQQRPQDIMGGAFKSGWFNFYTKNQISFHDEQWWFEDEPMVLFQGVDPAISEKDAADDFVIVTLGITPTNKIILLDVFHDHIDFIDQVHQIIKQYQMWLPQRVGIETNAYQRALKQQVIRDALIPVKALEHHSDKFMRILTMTPFYENGQVYIRKCMENEPGFVDLSRRPDVKIHQKFKKFWEQAVSYTEESAHEDILDATQNAFEIAKPAIQPNEYYC